MLAPGELKGLLRLAAPFTVYLELHKEKIVSILLHGVRRTPSRPLADSSSRLCTGSYIAAAAALEGFATHLPRVQVHWDNKILQIDFGAGAWGSLVAVLETGTLM
jgi:hypothetical protein